MNSDIPPDHRILFVTVRTEIIPPLKLVLASQTIELFLIFHLVPKTPWLRLVLLKTGKALISWFLGDRSHLPSLRFLYFFPAAETLNIYFQVNHRCWKGTLI